MPLFMAGAQFWQASLTPASPAMDPAQQKMMRYMPLVMVFVFYNYSSGLALYWCVSTLLTVLQTKLTKTNTPVAATTAPVPARVPQRKK
jgi:YidC/Oxa1 family membrane protein insertase